MVTTPEDTEEFSEPRDVDFEVKNPCRIVDFVDFTQTDDNLPEQETSINIGEETTITFNQFDWSASFNAQICGIQSYTITYDGSLVTADSVPMKLEDDTFIDDPITLIVKQDDPSAAGEANKVDYVIRGFFELYPDAISEEIKYTR